MAERPPGTDTTRDVRMQVGSYRVTDVLGDGASAIVYAGVDPSGREVALKVLKPDLALSERERRRFLEEAERLRRVRHPSLVEVLDAGPLPDGAYIAMARVPGVTLVDRLRRGPLRFDVTLSLFEQLADALGVIHAAGLVHRDIKPENILVADGDQRALLLDLGIARDVSANPSTTTRAGMIRGTPAYMAPERFFGKPATPQTDIYELGVVLYFTLVGALPWSSFDNPTERMRPAAPSERGVVLPPRLTTTLMRALSAEADQRPRTAKEFAAAVSDALSPESMQLIAGQHTARGITPAIAPPTSAPPAGALTATIPLQATPMMNAPPSGGAAPPPAFSPPQGFAPPPPSSGAFAHLPHAHASVPSVTGAQGATGTTRSGSSAVVPLVVLFSAALVGGGALLYSLRKAPAAANDSAEDAGEESDDSEETTSAPVASNASSRAPRIKMPRPPPAQPSRHGFLACSTLKDYYCYPPVSELKPRLCVDLGDRLAKAELHIEANRIETERWCSARLEAHRRAAD